MNEVTGKVGIAAFWNSDRVAVCLIRLIGRWLGLKLRASQRGRRFACTRGGREGTSREERES